MGRLLHGLAALALGSILAPTGAYAQTDGRGAALGDPTAEVQRERPRADDRVRVRVVPYCEETTLHASSGEVLCEAPCRLALTRGEHRFGVSFRDSEIGLADPIVIDRPGRLRVRYVSHGGLRTLGWVLIGVLGSSGAAGLFAGGALWATGEIGAQLAGLSFLVLGGFHALLTLVMGVPMVAAGDGVSVRFD